MRQLSTRVPGAGLAALVLCLVFLTATALAGDGNGNGNPDNSGKGNAGDRAPSVPASTSAAPATPPTPAEKPATPPRQSATKPGATPATPATPASGGSPATPAIPATPAAPKPVAPAAPPVIGESMGLEPVDGAVRVRVPNSTGYVSLAAAGSVPSGSVIDARRGTIVLRSAIDSKGRTQAATIRGAIFEVRQAADGKGMTELVLRDGRPKNCPATGGAAVARAAMTRAIPTKSSRRSGRLWARDEHGRFKTRGRNSVATVRVTRSVTHETCAGTLTRVMQGAVDVFDVRKHRTMRVRAGHTYLARTSG